jgi:hypothetical protein
MWSLVRSVKHQFLEFALNSNQIIDFNPDLYILSGLWSNVETVSIMNLYKKQLSFENLIKIINACVNLNSLRIGYVETDYDLIFESIQPIIVQQIKSFFYCGSIRGLKHVPPQLCNITDLHTCHNDFFEIKNNIINIIVNNQHLVKIKLEQKFQLGSEYITAISQTCHALEILEIDTNNWTTDDNFCEIIAKCSKLRRLQFNNFFFYNSTIDKISKKKKTKCRITSSKQIFINDEGFSDLCMCLRIFLNELVVYDFLYTADATIDIISSMNWPELETFQLGEFSHLKKIHGKQNQLVKILQSPKLNHFISFFDYKTLTDVFANGNFQFPCMTINAINNYDELLRDFFYWAANVTKLFVTIRHYVKRNVEQELVYSRDLKKVNVDLEWSDWTGFDEE